MCAAVLLDRQVQHFQFRIQQSIGLCDDELNRLSARLQEYQTERLSLQAELGETERQLAEAQDLQDGELHRQAADSETSLARLRSALHHEAQSLQSSQSLEIEVLEEKFESDFALMTHTKTTAFESRCLEIETAIQRCESRIRHFDSETATL
jgi:hypothetical protein